MTITFDREIYIILLTDFVPQVINSEVEYDSASGRFANER